MGQYEILGLNQAVNVNQSYHKALITAIGESSYSTIKRVDRHFTIAVIRIYFCVPLQIIRHGNTGGSLRMEFGDRVVHSTGILKYIIKVSFTFIPTHVVLTVSITFSFTAISLVKT